MKISYNWLKDFISFDWNAEQTEELLTDLGLEVEGIQDFESVKGGLKGVLVGEVLTCEKHPNADKLKITTVDLGLENPLQIVCGAKNVAKGQKVPVATVGTELYDADGKSFKIKKGNIRGEESFGMICAEDELGLGSSHEGIMVLDSKLKPGTKCSEVFKIVSDKVFEIGLTPNRADAMSHYGVARDLKAGFAQKNIITSFDYPSVSDFHIDTRTSEIDVEINSKNAPKYFGICVSELVIKDSPDWIKNRLNAIGITPKNNVVDITNYVLHEIGQPLHAFDLSKINGNKVIVRNAKENELFTTLDGIERKLSKEDLVIADNEKPMCIAGVLGGIDSGVTENTTEIFLESAYFDAVSIRKSAKRHAVNTDASFRFERGIDPESTLYGLQRAVLLLEEYADAKVTSDIFEHQSKEFKNHTVAFSYSNANKIIGEEIPRDIIKNILHTLEIKVTSISKDTLSLEVPAYRVDVTREADVIEEILRVYGYNNIKFSSKVNASMSNSSKFEDYKIQNKIAGLFVANGFNEIMSNSLTTNNYQALLKSVNEKTTVKILNPLSSDLSVLRQSLLFSGLESIQRNINRKRNDLKLFEFGKTYNTTDNGYKEDKILSLFTTGNTNSENWNSSSTKTDFFFLKGLVISVLERLGIQKIYENPTELDSFSEGLEIGFGKFKLVSIGKVSSRILKKLSINQEVYYAEFNWDTILDVVKFNKVKFKELPKFPEVRRDFALLLDKEIAFKDIWNLSFKTEKKLLKSVNLFDVYEGDKLPKDKKSYAVSFTFLDENKTMTDKQIDSIMKKLEHNFSKEFNATLR